LRDTLNQIESLLITKFRPTFLAITYDAHNSTPFIHIVMSSKQFESRTVDERIAQVFNWLHKKDKDIVEKNAIIVEAFDSAEMRDVFEYIK